MSFSFKADNELITAIRDRAMFNTFAGNQSYVIKGIGQELAVTVTPSTLNVSVGSGEAVICGGSTIIDSDNSLTLGANESGYLVIRIDLSQTQENICQFMKVPTLVQQNINNGTDLIYDLPLYQYTTNTSTVTSLVDIRSIRDYADTSLDGGTKGQILTKNSNNNGDFSWKDTDYMEVDTLGSYEGATPINADLLEGYSASYFQRLLTVGTGIDISNNVISNQFANLPSGTDLNTIRYNYQGYAPTPTNAPSSASYNLIVVCRKDGLSGLQIASKYNDTVVYARTWYTSSGTRIWNNWKRIITEPVPLWENSSVDTTFPPQTLTLDLSGYSFVVIQTKIVANSFYYINSVIRINGYDNIVLGRVNNGAEIRSRLLTVRTNSIQFYNAYTGTTLDNASMIPFKIWGL